MTDAELLSAAIRASGLSVRGFRRAYFPRANERTIWRWLAGTHPMRQPIRDTCLRAIQRHQDDAAREAFAHLRPTPQSASTRALSDSRESA